MTTARATRFIAVGLTGAALFLVGCGDDKSSSDTSTSAATSASTPAATTPAAAAVRAIRNPYSKPTATAHPGANVDQLIVRDVRVGRGETLEAGDTAIADYYGALYSNGRMFDSSWQPGRRPLEIRIDNGGVIPGWWQGIPGMRVGGRRVLVIPAALGYGRQGQPPTIPPNSTLYFVVDLLGVRKAEPASAEQTQQQAPAGG